MNENTKKVMALYTDTLLGLYAESTEIGLSDTAKIEAFKHALIDLVTAVHSISVNSGWPANAALIQDLSADIWRYEPR